MSKQQALKSERVIEAVRRGLEGDAAVDFIRQSGYAMTVSGIARHLKSMGGRGRVLSLIGEGATNVDILKACLPDVEIEGLNPAPPKQAELFVDMTSDVGAADDDPFGHSLYDTVKINLRLPADVYEAVRLAARAEQKTQNELIVELLTRALSRVPEHLHMLDEA